MRSVLYTCMLILLFISRAAGQTAPDLEQLLFDLPDVRFQKVEDRDGFPAYMLKVKQPVDHENSEAGYFYQQVYLVHRGFDKPTLMNTDGYTLTKSPSELYGLLETNYVSVEHRFFGSSTPEGKPWKNLTIQQAAADYHHIRELLGQLYSHQWVSTGISKGGETCTYYKFFYPNDVSLSVPYVAPFPDGLKDQRIYKFLDTTGTAECREKIFTFQKNVLKNKDKILPLFEYYLKGKGAKVDLIGGPEAALELFVLEYPFSFWQAGKDEAKIPAADADHRALLDHIVDSGDFWYLLDNETESLAAHYYQHATQFGYYGYQTERFGDLIKKWQGEPSACFFPYEKDLKFDPQLRKDIIAWLQKDAQDLLFVYGAVDTWTVCQAEIGQNVLVKKYILPGKNHYNARLNQADEVTKKEILDWIRSKLAGITANHGNSFQPKVVTLTIPGVAVEYTGKN